MKYLHYEKINKQYFYWFDNNPYWKNSYSFFYSQRVTCSISFKKCIIQAKTKKEAKAFLKEKFPDYEPIYTIAFHEGARWFGQKKGSRRYKI